jgi:hypothetical protein
MKNEHLWLALLQSIRQFVSNHPNHPLIYLFAFALLAVAIYFIVKYAKELSLRGVIKDAISVLRSGVVLAIVLFIGTFVIIWLCGVIYRLFMT